MRKWRGDYTIFFGSAQTRKLGEHCVENKEADKSTQRDPFRLFRLCLLVM